MSKPTGKATAAVTTTSFDMAARNDLDRFHRVADVIDRAPKRGYKAAYLKQQMHDKLIEHRRYIERNGQDLPETLEWKWQALEISA